MYTRSYYQENSGGVPRDYDGNAFRTEDTPTVVTPTYGETKVSPEYMAEDTEEVFQDIPDRREDEGKEETEGIFSRLISRIPVKKLPFGLGSLFGRGRGFSSEDAVIIAVALLLLLSGEGDKLLGIALLALLFV